MHLRQVLLLILFGTHWVIFTALLVRRRNPSLLLPVGVFTLLVLTQVFWQSPAHVHLGPLGDPSLRITLRVSAAVLAVPSLGMLLRRLRVWRAGARGS